MSLEDRFYPILSTYERLPRAVRWAAGVGFRQLPERWRRGATYAEFERLAGAAAGWSPEQTWDYQLGELRRTLRHAQAHCPFYRRSFAAAGFDPDRLQAPSDLVRCPMLEKHDLLENGGDLVSAALPPSARLYLTTGGSTGVPVGFYLHKGVSRAKEQAFIEATWSRGGYYKGARLALIRGQITSSRAAGRVARYDAVRDWLLLSSYHLTEDRLPEYLEAIERFRPDLVNAYPSAALLLAELLERSGRRWQVPLKGLLCGSERLTLPQKRLLERVFDCRVLRWYGHAERVVLAGETRTSELFYFWPQYGFVEFGPPDEEGLREVIGTSFHNLVMPLVRYRTGDYVRLASDDPARRAPELPWPAAAEIAGREQEFLVSGTGRRISLAAFNMHDDVFDGLYAVQFYQDEPGLAEFRYVAGPRFPASRLEGIAAAMRKKLGDDFRVEFRQVQQTEKTSRGKHCWLVSRLPTSGSQG